jgi:SAM-dependent methyltransferase/aminoglycoside phosphotransferase (APT) family kinase protein
LSAPDGAREQRARAQAAPPTELDGALGRAIAALEGGAAFKAAYEALLLEISDETADRLMQLQREARGTWLVLLRAIAPAEHKPRALLIGDALSGTSVPLGYTGFRTTLYDRSALRLRFAELRNRALTPGDEVRSVLRGDETRLPFEDGEFDLVVQEAPLDARDGDADFAVAERRRVCSGEWVWIADNRFAYKRSSGRRGVFRVPSPIEYARRVLHPSGERSLAGYREACAAPSFAPPRAFALYPDAREFTYVVGLDGEFPSLEVGPKERDNKLKLLGASLGLFPLFTPSFALLSARREHANAPPRVERLLDELAKRTGEPRGELEHVVATRGNTALLMTRRPPSLAGDSESARDDGRGEWCVHIGLSAAQRSQLATHARFLELISRRFPAVPVPQPLFHGEFDGLYLTCERRARGLTAPQHTGDLAATRTLLGDTARVLAELVVEPARPMDEADFESLVARRFALVERFCGHPDTAANLRRMLERARASLLGRAFPRVLYHADLRSKHIQVDARGHIVALLDWGSGEERDLPYFDLLHLIAHERKQAEGWDAKRAWALVRERTDLRDYERAALDDYSARLGLDDEYRRTLEALYPVLVAAMAESHWDFSRPRWLRRQFGI